MVLQGFEPLNHTTSELVSFCERHEFAEGTLDNSDGKEAKPKTDSKSGMNGGKSRAKSSAEAKSNSNSNKRNRNEKWCDLHQTNGHDTSECKVVQSQISKMRQSWESVRPNKSNSYKKDDKTKDKKELMSLVKQGIKSFIKNKKQKTEKSYNVEKEDDESDFDIDKFKNLDVSDSDSDNNDE
jgi:hypothetical protein